MKINVGMQFYTLRDEMSQGYEAILKRIAEVGYTGVEMTYSPNDGDIIRSLLKKYNLKGTGAHIGIDEIENHLDRVTGFMENLGSKSVIIPWIGGRGATKRSPKRRPRTSRSF